MRKIFSFICLLIPFVVCAQIPYKPNDNSRYTEIPNMLIVRGYFIPYDSIIASKARIDNLKSKSVTNAINTAKNELQGQLDSKLNKTAKAANSELFAGKDTNYYKNNWGTGATTLVDDIFSFDSIKYTPYTLKTLNVSNFYRSTETPDNPPISQLPLALNYSNFVVPALMTTTVNLYTTNSNGPWSQLTANQLTCGRGAVTFRANGSYLNYSETANDTTPIFKLQREGADRFKFRRNGNLDITGDYMKNGVPITLGGTWGNITGTLADQTDLNDLLGTFATTTDVNTALNEKEGTITAGTTDQYYRGDKTWQILPTYTVSKGLTKIGNDFQLGGAIGADVAFSGNYAFVFGSGAPTSMLGQFSVYQRNAVTGKTASFNMWNNGDISFSGSSITSTLINYDANRAASYTDRSVVDRNFVDSLVTAKNTPTLPINPTENDVLWAITPDGKTRLYKIDSLYNGPEINGIGFIKANGTNLTYDNTTYQPIISLGATTQYYRGDKTWQVLNKAAVGLPLVDNTPDLGKPVSTATQTALNGKENSLGNPAANGYLLSSTTTGVRTWIPAPAGLSHDAVTIGTANGLSLSGQQISLGLASTTTNGALSSAAFNTFNNKVSFPGFGTTSTTAAAGNHNHTGVYEPKLVNPSPDVLPPVGTNYFMVGNASGSKSWRQYTGNAYQNLDCTGAVTMNVRDGYNARITLSCSISLTLSNLQSGDEGNIIVTQDATGNRTLTILPSPKVIDGGAGTITLTGTPGSTDVISYTYDGVNLYITYGLNYN